MSGEEIYCAGDLAEGAVGQVDLRRPTQFGRLLAAIGTTYGDELKMAGFPSRVVSIAIKDRAAIFLGGHLADLALWIDPKAGQWVSSHYYLPDGKLPSWVDSLNQQLVAQKGTPYVWDVEHGAATGFSGTEALALTDAINSGKVGGDTFPHRAERGSRGSFSLPAGSEITERAAEQAVGALALGSENSTDVLAVSFSSHDYLAHAFGYNAREMEEMTVADRVIAKFLGFLEKIGQAL